MTFLSFLFAFVGICVLVMVHEGAHMYAAIRMGVNVERYSLFFPPYIWKKQLKNVELALGSVPLGGSVKLTGMDPRKELPEGMTGKAYYQVEPWRRIVIIAAGPLSNIILGILIFILYFSLAGPWTLTTNVDSVAKGYPAAGMILKGDKIVSVDGKQSTDPAVLSNQVNKHHCATAGCVPQPVTVVVKRDGQLKTLTIDPKYDKQLKRERLGITFLISRQPVNVLTAGKYAMEQTWAMTKATATIPIKVFHAKERQQLGSIAGAFETTRKTVKTSFTDALLILSVLSISIGILNCLILLPLDGGHALMAAIEWVRKKPVSMKAMERYSIFGIVIIIILFAIGINNDIGHLLDGTLGQIQSK